MKDDGWTRYWQDQSRRGCVPNAGSTIGTTLEACWHAFAAKLPTGSAVIDLAAGDGAVGRALSAARPDLSVIGVDRAVGVRGAGGAEVRAGIDCTELPFTSGAFAAVTSQFGIEYCPPEALMECARVVRSGGQIRWLVHHRDSKVVRHNAARRAAARAIVAAGLFDSARRVAVGQREHPEAEAAIAQVRRTHAGQSIVEELPAALGAALRGVHPLAQIAAIERALADELARLAALASAAQSAEGIKELCAAAERVGLPLTAVPLMTEEFGPVAWQVEGIRV